MIDKTDHSKMTLDQLRILVAVASRGHMTRAAKDLHMTQSAVSAAIAALEHQHRVRLFDRIGRGIALTDAGHAFVPMARQVLAQAETARLLLADLSRETRGRLRVHASQTVASHWLPERLVKLYERHPGIEIEVTTGNTAQVAQAVSAGSADLGFVEGEVAQGDLLRRIVTQDELVLVAAMDNPFAALSNFDAAAYRAMTWIMREPGSGTRAQVEAHLAEMGLRVADLDVAFEIPSNEAVLAAVAAGRMVSMISHRAASHVSGVRSRHVSWTTAPRRTFSVLSHPQRHRTRAVQAMLDLVSDGT